MGHTTQTLYKSPVRGWAFWRKLAQIAFLLAALVTGLRHLVQRTGGSIEATCPFGAVETAWSVWAKGTFLRHLGLGNGVALLIVLISALLLGRLFCGWACPVGTLQDALAGLARRIAGRDVTLPVRVPRAVDRILRFGKVAVLAWVIWASMSAVVPPLAPFCPYRTLFEFGNLGSTLSLGIILGFGGLSLWVERFWCRYLCPLGALLAPLNRISPLRPRVNAERCVACGRCEQACPAGIDPVRDGTQHFECVRCFACVDACRRPGAMRVG